MTDHTTQAAVERLATIKDIGEGYSEAILAAYAHKPFKQLYADLDILLSDHTRQAERIKELEGLLGELVAMVRGECPSLLNEDSGGDAELSCRIDEALSGQPAAPSLPAEVVALVKALSPFMPITTRDTPDYAEVTFGDHQSQAMTMDPAAWNALTEAYAPFADRVAVKPVKMLVDQDWLARHVATDPDSSVEAGAVRNTERLPARDLTDAELIVEQTRVEKLWDSLHEPDEDGEVSGRGGSPGEWMVERMDEIATEQDRRGIPAVAEQTEGEG